MKIVQVTHTFFPYCMGGRERYVYNLSMALARRGHEVHVFTGEPPSSNLRRIRKIGNVTVRRFMSMPIRLASRPIRIYYRFLPTILHALVKERADVVHAHEYFHFTTDISALACKISKKPLIITIHGSRGNMIPTKALDATADIYDQTIGSFTLKAASRIIVVSKQMKRELMNRGVDQRKIVEIPNGVNVKEINGSRDYNVDWSIDARDQHETVLSVGRLAESKGYRYLIDAIPQILEKINGLKVVLVGKDHGYKEELLRQAKNLGVSDVVEFKGFVPDAELIEYMRKSNVFVLPSLYEGMPSVLFEAMSLGKPVVATKVGGIPEIIENRRNGILVEPGSSAQLAEAIIELIGDEAYARKLGIEGKESVKKYSWESISKQIEREYYECLKL